MTKKHKLPETIYVKWEEDPKADTRYLTADETPNSMDDGDVVGIYELVKTRVLKISRELK